MLLHEPEKLRHRHGKRLRHPLDIDQTQVPRAALDVAQIGPVDVGSVREILLRQAKLLAPDLDGKAEALADIWFLAIIHCGDGSRV
jgi:hypothetical protein